MFQLHCRPNLFTLIKTCSRLHPTTARHTHVIQRQQFTMPLFPINYLLEYQITYLTTQHDRLHSFHGPMMFL